MRNLHARARAAIANGMRFGMNSSPALELVEILDELGLRIAPADTNVLGAQDLAQLIADQVDDALEVERPGHALLNAVDHRELGVALENARLFDETQRLLKETEQRNAEGNAHACRHGREQPHFGV